MAGILYKILLASPDDARNEIRQACFDYLSLGGKSLSGMGVLLSGLNPQPMVLVFNILVIASFGAGRLLVPVPSVKRLWLAARLILSGFGIIFPLIKAEGVRQMFFPWTIPAIYRAPPTCYPH